MAKTTTLTTKQITALKKRVKDHGLGATASACEVSDETLTRALAGLKLRRGTLALFEKHLGDA